MIRPAERGDLASVAALYELVVRSGRTAAPPGLAREFEALLFENPYAEPDLPSLVWEEYGAVIGFIAVHARRAELDGRPVRIACAGQLVTNPASRATAPGLFLVRAMMSGTQDLTITDTAGVSTRRMWDLAGGRPWELASITWVKLLRAPRFAVEHAATRLAGGRLRRGFRPLGIVMDGFDRRVRRPSRAAGGLALEPGGPSDLVSVLPRLIGDRALRPAYDETFARWLLERVASVRSRGYLRLRVASSAVGPVGLVAYRALPGGIADVLLLAASRRAAGDVLDALFAEARRDGAAVVRGRLEPGLLEPLSDRRCLFRYNGYALVHGDPHVVRAALAGDAFLSRLDGEYWTGLQLEPYLDEPTGAARARQPVVRETGGGPKR